MRRAEHPEKDSQMREHGKKGASKKDVGPDNVPAKGIIHMIVGGPADGDSRRARHAHARAARTIMEIDDKASADVLFYKVYQQMELGYVPPEPVDMSLYGFAGEVVQLLGHISLPLSLRSEPTHRTRMVNFLVVDMPSAYNLILGRPTLNTFHAVVSTYHMKLKFPVGDNMGEVRGDQYIVESAM
ncbi:UNVERIFIED_CONTAM: hypothetical protein Slati_0162400 [Sesamum latifolium]|uniref:Uncharacterized protein n=1 Tax=Sesamum latifolium TaxID=2727402 RepID=A0AAW2YA70_9LAMI